MKHNHDKYAELRAALAAVPKTGQWYYAGCNTVHDAKNDEVAHPFDIQNNSATARYIAAANPEAIRALLGDYAYQQGCADRFADLYHQVVNSVCRELEKHGIEEINSLAEAIEVLVSDKDKEIARLRETLKVIANTRARPCDEKAALLLASVINLASVALAQEQERNDETSY